VRTVGLVADRTDADGTGPPSPPASDTPSWVTAERVVVVGLTAVLAVPVLVALGALHSPRWFPLVDMAQIELRVRDVPTSHPPLIGLGGRIRAYDQAGSHPGPLGFYALWPVYRLLGASAWALQVSTAALSLLAAGVAVWIARRRGGPVLALGMATTLALLLRAYGAVMVTEPWNPRLPVVWWIVLLLAVWSVLCGDLALLPVVVVAGTFCAQTHIPYVVLVGGLWLLTAGGLVQRSRRVRDDPEARRDLRRRVAVAGGLLGLLWLPAVVEEITHSPGNVTIIVQNFLHPYDDRVPVGDAVNFWLHHLDVTDLVRGDLSARGTPVWGIVSLVVWAGSVVVARRRRHSTLLALHAVTGTALAFGLVAVTRIFGPLWSYLAYWAWGTTALMAQ